MLHTFETRLTVSADIAALLSANAAHWSWGLRKCWSLLYRQKFTRVQTYAAMTKAGFTSAQVGSLLIAAEMKHAGLVALIHDEQAQLALAIKKREHAIRAKQKKIATLQKRQARLREQRATLTLKQGAERSEKLLGVLAHLREIPVELAFCQNWVKQKQRALAAKCGRRDRLQADIAAGHYRRCFGSKKLLSQRPATHNQATTPFACVDDWQATWACARNAQWWSIGTTDKPQGNAEVQWLPETKQLRLRLTDRLAHERMDARGIARAGGKQGDMPKRMQCRFIVLGAVDFSSHKGAAATILRSAFGKLPVTMRLLARLQEDGTRAWYVQASVNVPTGFTAQSARSREAGVVGLDLNARGVAWCAVKPDGNRLVKERVPQRGFTYWDLRDKTQAERRQIVGTTVHGLAKKAAMLGMAVSIENLDFATKKLTMRAGAVNKRYNAMLSTMAFRQFADMMARACEKQGVKLYQVNPSYSSMGGFMKYGRLNRCTVDEAAAHWLGRQALFGSVWKTEGAVYCVKKQDERRVFPHLPVTRMQSMKALAGVQWKDVARGVGKNRMQWGKQFHQWLLCQVEAASASEPGEPSAVLSPAGMKTGSQSGISRTPDSSAHAEQRSAC